MALLFVGGLMNLTWIVAITLLLAGETILARGILLAREAAIAVLGWSGAALAMAKV